MVSDPLPVIDSGCDEYNSVLFFLFLNVLRNIG